MHKYRTHLRYYWHNTEYKIKYTEKPRMMMDKKLTIYVQKNKEHTIACNEI